MEQTVHVIDDDKAVRDALDTLMRSVGLRVRTYASTAEFAGAPLKSLRGCLILDVRLPGLSGLEFQRMLERDDVKLPIIFITGHGDIPMSVQAMKGGAVEFLPKPFREQALLDAITQALEQDRRRCDAEVCAARVTGAYATLTARERQVMELVVSGKMNKQVAGALDLSEVTVKLHRGHVMQKMGATSLADLVRMADRIGGSADRAA